MPPPNVRCGGAPVPLDVEPIGILVHRRIAVRGGRVHADEVPAGTDPEQLDGFAGVRAVPMITGE